MIPKGIIVDVNDRYLEILGYERSELIGSHITVITPETHKEKERENLQYFLKHLDEATGERRLLTKQGNVIDVLISSTKFYQNGELYVYATLRDISNEKRHQSLLEDTGKIAQLGGWERNLKTGEIIWTDVVYDIHEIDRDADLSIDMLLNRYVEKDREKLSKAINEATETGKPYDLTLQMIGAKGTKKWVRVTAKTSRIDNQIIKIYGTIQDVTNSQKDKKLMEQSLQEKIVLIKEIHHRVKNNLAVISGLLELQAMGEEHTKTRTKLFESQARIKSIAMIHEMLYKNEFFTGIELPDYLKKLIGSIQDMYAGNKEISFKFNFEKLTLNINQAVPFGILANELITNSFKHAFKDRDSGVITIGLETEDNVLNFYVQDNGKGFDTGITKKSVPTLGLTLIDTLATQLNGETCWESSSKGTRFSLRFIPED